MPGIKQTHCKQGHPLSRDNVYRKQDGTVQCKICHNQRKHEHYMKNREKCLARAKELKLANRAKQRECSDKTDAQLDYEAAQWLSVRF